jgi:hypothetical protein
MKCEGGEWESVVIWDKGCCLPRVIAFAIHSNIEVMGGSKFTEVEKVMEGAQVATAPLEEDYDNVCKCTIAKNEAKFCDIFGQDWN